MPFTYQRSIVIYHCEDDSVDWTDLGQVDWLNKNRVQIWIDDFIKVYGDKEFRVGTISVEDVKEKIMPRVTADLSFETFDEYHEWFKEGTFPDHGDSVFPIVISENEHFDRLVEYIKDGWHRFHSYVNKGLKEIPFVEYV